jgi:hypothetical protein
MGTRKRKVAQPQMSASEMIQAAGGRGGFGKHNKDVQRKL